MQEKEIAKLKDELKMMNETLNQYNTYFMEDGTVDALEQQHLDSMVALIKRVEDKIKELSTSNTPENTGNNSSAVIATGYITASKLNVRSGPSTEFDKTGKKLTKDDKVDIFETKDEWHRIGNDEWISGKYVDTSGKVPQKEEEEEVIEVSGSGPSSSNFKFTEFVPLHRPYYKHANNDPKKAVPKEYWPNIQKVMNNLEIIRSTLGKSMNINSGYRNEAHNAAVGGAKKSQHKVGKAADFYVKGMTPKEVYAVVEKLMDDGKISKGGMGLYNTFVHYDVRGSKVKWNG
jgi:hypothetical protein